MPTSPIPCQCSRGVLAAVNMALTNGLERGIKVLLEVSYGDYLCLDETPVLFVGLFGLFSFKKTQFSLSILSHGYFF